MQLVIETTMLIAPGSCSGAILCLLHRATAGEAPALAGAAAAGAPALALNVDIQLHAVKQCSPLESKLRHRLLQHVLITCLTFLPQSSGLVCLQPFSQMPGSQTWTYILLPFLN